MDLPTHTTIRPGLATFLLGPKKIAEIIELQTVWRVGQTKIYFGNHVSRLAARPLGPRTFAERARAKDWLEGGYKKDLLVYIRIRASFAASETQLILCGSWFSECHLRKKPSNTRSYIVADGAEEGSWLDGYQC